MNEPLSDTALRSAIDFSGVDAFWPVMHKLAAGQEPSESEWSAMLNSPGYVRLSRNAALQRDMRLAFKPEMEQEFKRIVGQEDYHSQVVMHLRRFADEEKAIQQYQNSFDGPSILHSALERCSAYLAPAALQSKPLPRIMFLVFEPDGQLNGDMVILDVLYAKMQGDERIRNLLAHELHHYYKPTRLEEPERTNADYALVHAVKQLQLEGLADLIDKKAYPVQLLNQFAQDQYNKAYPEAPHTLRQFDELVSAISDHPEKMHDDGEQIWHSLVLAGHPVGFYMVNRIMQHLGKETLVESEADPFELFWLYNQSIEGCKECSQFSAKTLGVLAALRAKYLIKGEPSRGATWRGERIDAAALRDVITEQIPHGFSGTVLVAGEGRIILNEGFGEIKGQRMTAETRFWIASSGKQFTSAAIMLCKDRGLLSLEDRLPKFFSNVPTDKKEITIRELLTHSSGFGQSYVSESAKNRNAAVKAILADPLADIPGARFHYSNNNYQLAVAIVEIVTKANYRDFVRKQLWHIAGLRHTGFAGDKESRKVAPAQGDLPSRLRTTEWGGEGVYSTTGDLYHWYRTLTTSNLLAPSSVADLMQPSIPIQEGRAGMGWFVNDDTQGRTRIFTRGNEDFGPNSLIYSYPKTGTIVIVLTHAGNANDDISWSRFVLEKIEASIAAR